ncbi:MAG: tRNA (adenine(22)-N(1))-methyltransferase TrmK, partial [Firmicutes bacterium]|nr:tRNA (adenine(22)-N(1))-methyltransferase TrmK [Bacillota bacterium]
ASVKLFVLQPRTEEGMLRAWLREKGWGFYKDCLVREGTFLCQIIAVVPPKMASHAETVVEEERKRLEEERKMKEGPIAPWAVTPNVEDVIDTGEAKPKKKPLAEELTELCEVLEWDASPLWFLEKDPLAAEYVQRTYVKEEGILNALKQAKSPESAAKEALTGKKADALKRLAEIASQSL